MIQAYADESGGKGQGEVFNFSALICDANTWADFAEKWQSCLDENPRLEYFKMDEAVGFSEQFARSRFSKNQRDERLKSFCKIISSYFIIEFSFITVLKDFEEHWAYKLGRPASEPYFFPFLMTILGVGYEVLSMNVRTPFEIFFDENVIFGPRAKAWYPIIRAIQEDAVKEVMPVEPFFRSDKDILPLQAADLTAWMQREHNEGGLGEFDWLRQELSGLTLSPLSKILDEKKIMGILNHKYTPDEIERNKVLFSVYQETFGHKWPPKNKLERRKSQGRK
jgi:Protein of unknown function (DUF3800)